ncbi:hypothetical protein [Nonomuraea rubra]|uniref:hypothetical protein n=1 Tax=Nonomuraea rubra TaxID=46180 RepID=UPI003409BAC9
MTGVLVREVSLRDPAAVESLGAERPPGAYHPAAVARRPPPLPPNVNRHLMTRRLAGRMRRLAQAGGIDDLHLRVISHALRLDGRELPAPLHFALAFRHEDLRVAGPVFVSVLHEAGLTVPPGVLAEPWAAGLREVGSPLDALDRRLLLEHYLREYRDGARATTDLTVICVPARPPAARAASPTHQALLTLSGAAPLPVGSWDGYPVWHAGRPRPLPPPLLDSLDLLRREWSEQTRLAHERGGSNRQSHVEIAVLVDWIRSSWRSAMSSKGAVP